VGVDGDDRTVVLGDVECEVIDARLTLAFGVVVGCSTERGASDRVREGGRLKAGRAGNAVGVWRNDGAAETECVISVVT
jgi:hypothetical protein